MKRFLKHQLVLLLCLLNLMAVGGGQNGHLDTLRISADRENNLRAGIRFKPADKAETALPRPESMEVHKSEQPINLGFSKTDYWFFFQFIHQEQEKNWILEFPYPFHDELQVWIITEGKDSQWFSFSDRRNFSERPVKNKNFQIPLNIKASELTKVYCRLQCNGEASSFPVNIYSPQVLQQKTYLEQLALGLYYGILLFAVLLSVFLVLRIGERAQYFYLCYLSGVGLFQFSLDGYAFQFFWPNHPWLANHIIPLAGSWTLFFLLQFTRSLLRISEHSPGLSKLISVLSLVFVVFFLCALTENPFFSFSLIGSNVLALPALILLLVSALISLKKKIPSSRYFSAAFLLLILGTGIALLKNLGILPRIFLTEYGIQIGSAVEIMMLSLGLAENLRSLKTEKEIAQARLLQELEEKYLLQEKAKAELERKVEERTKELKEKNALIESKNKDITDSIFYASRIQEATLPQYEEMQDLLPGSFVWYLPRDIVSGDFYWAGRKDGLIFVAVADCTGHGVPGSMMSMAAHSFFNEIINEHHITSASEILEVLRIKIIRLLRQDRGQSRDGMDISLLVIDPAKAQITFAGAYNPVYLLKSVKTPPHEEAILLKEKEDRFLWSLPANRFPVGMFRENVHDAFREITISMESGDCFLMFTDGFADQFGGEKGKKLKYSTLQEIFIHQPYPELKNTIETTFHHWKGDLEQVDDVCILGFRIP